jgi:Domain of unknown function (DUF4157)
MPHFAPLQIKSETPQLGKQAASPARHAPRKLVRHPSVVPARLHVQPKLVVGEPNDPLELEADRVAETVMRMPDDAAMATGISGLAPAGDGASCQEHGQERLRRKCAQCEEQRIQCEVGDGGAFRWSQSSTGELFFQTAETAGSPQGPLSEHLSSTQLAGRAMLEAQLRRARSVGGEPFPRSMRSFMEPRFGQDFSQVRVHRDARASALSEGLGARAFTVGRDMFFGQGEFEPQTESGRRLIAHELAHVVQQRASAPFGRQDEARLAASRTQSAPIQVQRAVSKVCNPPSMWAALLAATNPALAATAAAGVAAFGLIAEEFISDDVVTKNGVAPGDFYLDNPFAGPIDPNYVLFILGKNPSLSRLAKGAIAASMAVRPDVLMHQPGLTEFEEVKPDSLAGRSAGRAKVKGLNAFYSTFTLPYVPGSTYSPMPPFVIVSGTVSGVPVTVTFEVTRDRNGLLVYDICVETDWLKIAELAFLIAILIILGILAKGAIEPGEMPGGLPEPALAQAPGGPELDQNLGTDGASGSPSEEGSAETSTPT